MLPSFSEWPSIWDRLIQTCITDGVVNIVKYMSVLEENYEVLQTPEGNTGRGGQTGNQT